MASCLSIIGVDSWRLTGGYKAWRKQVLEDFDAGYPFKLVVLHGHTGVGKTEILEELTKLAVPVLNLEKIASHRGSVFGAMATKQPSQKNFDAAIWTLVKTYGDVTVCTEAESKKVGNLRLPEFISQKLEAGRRILVTGTLNARRQRILKDYVREDLKQEANLNNAIKSLSVLRERLGSKLTLEIEKQGRDGNFADAVDNLLIHYYDPLYQKQIDRFEPYELTVDGDDPILAARQIADWLD